MKPEGPRTQRMKIYSQSNRSGAPCQKLPHRRPSDSLQEQLFLGKFCQLHYIFSLGTGLCLHHTYLSSGKRKAAAAWPASDQQQHPRSHCRYRNPGSGQRFFFFGLCDFRKLSGRLSGRLLSGPQKSSAIGFVAGRRDAYTIVQRTSGFLNALKDAKLPAYPELYSYDLNGQMDGKEQMRRLLLFL